MRPSALALLRLVPVARAAYRRLSRPAQEMAQGYAWIALAPSWRAGTLLALLTAAQPDIGLMGLLGAVSAWLGGSAAGALDHERPVCVFNGLLCGLFAASVWQPALSVAAMTVMGAVLAGGLSLVLGRLSGSLMGLPVLSLPFALVSMLTSAAGGSMAALHPKPYSAPPALLGNGLDSVLTALGSLYFMPDPWIGLAVLTILLFFSRYYLMLALLGLGVAWLWFTLMGAAPEHLAGTAWRSNAMLAALLVGGLFATPSIVTAALAAWAAVLAAWLSLALGRILGVVPLQPFCVPFVLAVWMVLYLALRHAGMAQRFNLSQPDFPERTLERSRVARQRLGLPGSVPLALPFLGSWTVSQGFSGPHTHRGPWRHALDFIVLKEGRSFVGEGRRLEDFHCYQMPVVSPAHGQVCRIVSDVPDNQPGCVNADANWGNAVLIRLHDGKCVLLAHLQPGSLKVAEGSWVQPGDLLGLCGNSGRSPQPHLHLHVQLGAELGAPTVPFHLSSVRVHAPGDQPRYELAVVPAQNDTLQRTDAGEVRPFHALAGRAMHYQVEVEGSASTRWTLRCEVDALGRLALVSSAGARCLVESTWAVFSCYERDAVADPWLDLWLLAVGYSPASMQVDRWRDDCTPARLLPLRRARWLALLAWPWAAVAVSRFERHWMPSVQAWCQQAQHRQAGGAVSVLTQASIAPQIGCTDIHAECGTVRYRMHATAVCQAGDVGVPGWETALAASCALGQGAAPQAT